MLSSQNYEIVSQGTQGSVDITPLAYAEQNTNPQYEIKRPDIPAAVDTSDTLNILSVPNPTSPSGVNALTAPDIQSLAIAPDATVSAATDTTTQRAQAAIANASSLLDSMSGSKYSDTPRTGTLLPPSSMPAYRPPAPVLKPPSHNVWQRSPPRSPSSYTPPALKTIRKSNTEQSYYERKDQFQKLDKLANPNKVSFSNKNQYQEYKGFPDSTGAGQERGDDDYDDDYEEDGNGVQLDEEDDLDVDVDDDDDDDEDDNEDDDVYPERSGPGRDILSDLSRQKNLSQSRFPLTAPGSTLASRAAYSLSSGLPGVASSAASSTASAAPAKQESGGFFNSLASFFTGSGKSESTSTVTATSTSLPGTTNGVNKENEKGSGLFSFLTGSKRPNPFGLTEEHMLRSMLKSRLRRWYDFKNIEYKDEEINQLPTDILKQRVSDVEYDRSLDFYLLLFSRSTLFSVMLLEAQGSKVTPHAAGYCKRFMSQESDIFEQVYIDMYDEMFSTCYVSPLVRIVAQVLLGFFTHIGAQKAFEEEQKRNRQEAEEAEAVSGQTASERVHNLTEEDLLSVSGPAGPSSLSPDPIILDAEHSSHLSPRAHQAQQTGWGNNDRTPVASANRGAGFAFQSQQADDRDTSRTPRRYQ